MSRGQRASGSVGVGVGKGDSEKEAAGLRGAQAPLALTVTGVGEQCVPPGLLRCTIVWHHLSL